MKIVVEKIKNVLADDRRVVFAYLFGSFLRSEDFKDIDIGIYSVADILNNPFDFTTDLKIALSESTGLPPDIFDIVLINTLLESERMDSLLLLGEVFNGMLLLDRNPSFRTDLIEKISSQFRESEGILQEVLLCR